MTIAANRNKHIRAAQIPPGNHSEIFTEYCRKHNNANVLVLPGRFMNIKEANKCIEKFIDTLFEGGRHKKRLDLI